MPERFSVYTVHTIKLNLIFSHSFSSGVPFRICNLVSQLRLFDKSDSLLLTQQPDSLPPSPFLLLQIANKTVNQWLSMAGDNSIFERAEQIAYHNQLKWRIASLFQKPFWHI